MMTEDATDEIRRLYFYVAECRDKLAKTLEPSNTWADTLTDTHRCKLQGELEAYARVAAHIADQLPGADGHFGQATR